MAEKFPDGCTVLCVFESSDSFDSNAARHLELKDKLREKRIERVCLLTHDENSAPVFIYVVSNNCPVELRGYKTDIDIENIKIGK